MSKEDKETLTGCFNLQNEISCPQAKISLFFYKQKLCTLFKAKKMGYCASWTEAMSGRSANDSASTIIKILEQILLDLSNATNVITWTDSCVLQNRMYIISFTMADFLTKHPQREKIKVKYSTPGWV